MRHRDEIIDLYNKRMDVVDNELIAFGYEYEDTFNLKGIESKFGNEYHCKVKFKCTDSRSYYIQIYNRRNYDTLNNVVGITIEFNDEGLRQIQNADMAEFKILARMLIELNINKWRNHESKFSEED